MSERIHSQPKSKRTLLKKLIPAVTGTLVLLGIAVVGFQFFKAHPAASQTADTQAGKTTLNDSTSGRVLAKVNNQSITWDVVARECVARHGVEILDSLINRLLIQQECERRGVAITANEVQAEVAETAKKFNLPLDTWYKMLESERGLTREQYHQDIIWPMLALKKLAGKDVEVTEADMKTGFERDYGARVKARLILVEGNIRQANQIWQKCQDNPDDFDRIAREFSADPNTRPLGGVIPPIRKHGGNEQIEKQAFDLKPGEISGLIQVDEGRYVILKCEGFTEPVVDDIRTVWNDLYAQLLEEKSQQAVAEVFKEIKEGSRIDNFLTNKSTGGRTIQQTSALQPEAPIQTVKPSAAVQPATRR